MKSAAPVVVVLGVLLALWYAAVAPMNLRLALDGAERSGAEVMPATPVARQDVSVWRLMAQNTDLIALCYAQDRPRLPTPGQVAQELWASTGEMALEGRAMSRRSLIFHAWITLRSTLWGFLLGTAVGIAGAVGIVYSRTLNLSLMPWAIISQTIPIVALTSI
jgi:ABC-type nitrate/sulfonate/bicarbonate transport system, permease component